MHHIIAIITTACFVWLATYSLLAPHEEAAYTVAQIQAVNKLVAKSQTLTNQPQDLINVFEGK